MGVNYTTEERVHLVAYVVLYGGLAACALIIAAHLNHPLAVPLADVAVGVAGYLTGRGTRDITWGVAHREVTSGDRPQS